MFGFIRPAKSEMRVRELDRFKSVYCGLCHALRARYGRMHTFFLSYDMTFLALVLESLQPEGANTVARRCDASPVRKKNVLETDDALAYTADLSVLLTYHKLGDTVADERGLKRLGARGLRLIIRPGYRRAQQTRPEADSIMRACLAQLAAVERDKLPSIDRAADPFARLLAGCVPDTGDAQTRVLRELFYHIGRWIYLIDACYDVEEDWKSGGYNPITLRYELQEPALASAKDALEITLSRSLAAIHAAFELLDIKRDRELIENIICLGLPLVTRQVLDGTYQPNGGQSRHGSI